MHSPHINIQYHEAEVIDAADETKNNFMYGLCHYTVVIPSSESILNHMEIRPEQCKFVNLSSTPQVTEFELHIDDHYDDGLKEYLYVYKNGDDHYIIMDYSDDWGVKYLYYHSTGLITRQKAIVGKPITFRDEADYANFLSAKRTNTDECDDVADADDNTETDDVAIKTKKGKAKLRSSPNDKKAAKYTHMMLDKLKK